MRKVNRPEALRAARRRRSARPGERIAIAAATLGALLVLLPGAAVAFPFGTPATYAAGADPASVAAADLDGDGYLDLAVANNDSDNVSVLLGNGDGTYQPQAVYTTGAKPASVAAADFDADGDPDLAVANFRGDNVSVLLGNGNGTFQAQVPYATGDGAIWVATGFIDGDANVDMVVAESNIDEVSVLLGNGDGTFDPAVNYPAGNYPQSVTTGDFDTDGYTDLAVANISGTVSILLGNADGTFDTDVSYAAGTAPIALTTGDFDGDGDLDLAMANGFGSTDVSVLLGDGTGAFPTHTEYAAGDTPIAVSTGDFNADGGLDLAVANYFGTTDDVSVLIGGGDGTFAPQVVYAAGEGSSAIATGDVNGDGALDLAVANQFTNDVSVLLGTPSSGDSVDPEITITTPVDTASYVLGQSVLADFACTDAGGSGLASCVGTVADGNSIDTSSVGSKTFVVNAADGAGNTASETRGYKVRYQVLGGFPASFSKSSYNRGSTIPIKFRLGNAAGTRIPDAEAQALISPICRVRIVLDGTVQAGCATYDVATDTFQYNLKTSQVLQAGQHTVSLRVSALDGAVVNTDSATILMR